MHKSFKNHANIDSLALGGVSWEVKIEENCWSSSEICVFREGVKIQHIRSVWAVRKGSKWRISRCAKSFKNLAEIDSLGVFGRSQCSILLILA